MPAALLGFAVAAAFWPGLLSGSFVPRWGVIAVGLPLVSSIDARAIPEGLRWTLAFLLALGAVSLLGSPYPQAGAEDLLFVVLLCGAFLFGAEQASLDDVMTGIAWGAGISALLCIPQFFDWWQPVEQVSRPAGLFFSSEVMGEFASLVFVWAARSRRYWIAALMVAPIVLTGSRIGLFAAAIGLFWGRSWRVTAPAIVGLAFAGVGAVLFHKVGSAEHRVILWGAGLLSLSLLGNGLGYVTAAFPYEEFLHSDALQVLVELGIGGLVLVAIPIAAFRSDRGNDAERALFAAVCVEALVSFPLHFPASGFVAAVVAGYLAGTGPLVRVGAPHRRDEDECRCAWCDPAGYGVGGESRFCCESLPVRSLLAGTP